VGKTTLIQRVVGELGLQPGGFYTREIREEGERVGFEINVLTNGLPRMKGVLAKVGLPSPYRVGKYGVDIRDLEEVGAASLEAARKKFPLVIIDEIGNMELVSPRFQRAVIACLESPVPVLGVIKAGRGPFVDQIKMRSDVIVLTRDNFEAVEKQVKDRVLGLI